MSAAPASAPPIQTRDCDGHAAGQGIVEFGLILALAAAVALVVLVLFRPQLAFVLSLIGSEVEKSSWLAGALAGLA